jgi:hypothetical protein
VNGPRAAPRLALRSQRNARVQKTWYIDTERRWSHWFDTEITLSCKLLKTRAKFRGWEAGIRSHSQRAEDEDEGELGCDLNRGDLPAPKELAGRQGFEPRNGCFRN